MKIFTNDEKRRIDRYTIETEGVSPMEIIERVGDAVAAEITSRWRPSKQVVVFAGPDANGAEALAAARLLAYQGYRIHIFLFNVGGNKLSTECAACRDMLADCPGISLTEVVESFMMPELTHNMLIIDGLFGPDLSEPLKNGYSYLVQHINEAKATVVSIDIPSGISADWNPMLISRDVIHATLTLAVQFAHLAFFIADNADLVGEWKVLDIGLSDKAARNIATQYYLMEHGDAYRALQPRKPFTSKADYGSAIIYAGSYGMMGAAVLAARGALRSGAGRVTVESPRCGFNILQTAVPEALYVNNQGEYVIDRIHPLQRYNAVAIGPGLGTKEQTIRALEEFLASNKLPVILDADALNCIAKRPTMLSLLPPLSVITPHAGEFDRLFGAHATAEQRLHKACEAARHYNILIVLKGHHTAIIRPDGKIYFNASGTPAMATPGCGDVLTGVIASFLAQGYKPEIATLLAVYVHGLAGEIAEQTHGSYGVTAGDVADNLGRAIASILD